MSLIAVRTTEDETLIVHTSDLFPAPPRPTPAETRSAWSSAWARFDRKFAMSGAPAKRSDSTP